MHGQRSGDALAEQRGLVSRVRNSRRTSSKSPGPWLPFICWIRITEPAPAIQISRSQESRMRNDICAIVKTVRIKARLADDRIGIDAEIAQSRGDLLGNSQMDVAKRQCAVGPLQDG